MSCGKCGCMKLGPISLGLALGVTGALAVLIGSLWIMYYGAPPIIAQLHLPIPTLKEASLNALVVLIKGFIFGFFVALFYDLFSCCFRKCKCGRKSDESCAPSDKSEVAK